MKKITKDLIIAICLIAYVLILALAYTKMNIDRLSKDIQVFAGAFLVLGLLGLEKAYKSDDGKTAITAIELLVMSFYSLSIMHMVALIKCDFINYMFFFFFSIAIYYFIKEIIIFTKQKRDDLKNLSDISEIVKKGIETKVITSGGGHAMAAGFSLPVENIPSLREFLKTEIQYASKPKTFDVDAIVNLSDISLDFVKKMNQLYQIIKNQI